MICSLNDFAQFVKWLVHRCMGGPAMVMNNVSIIETALMQMRRVL